MNAHAAGYEPTPFTYVFYSYTLIWIITNL